MDNQQVIEAIGIDKEAENGLEKTLARLLNSQSKSVHYVSFELDPKRPNTLRAFIKIDTQRQPALISFFDATEHALPQISPIYQIINQFGNAQFFDAGKAYREERNKAFTLGLGPFVSGGVHDFNSARALLDMPHPEPRVTDQQPSATNALKEQTSLAETAFNAPRKFTKLFGLFAGSAKNAKKQGVSEEVAQKPDKSNFK